MIEMSSHKKYEEKNILPTEKNHTILLQSLIMDGIVYFIVSTYSLWNFSLKEVLHWGFGKLNQKKRYEFVFLINWVNVLMKYFIKTPARDLPSKKVNDLILNVNLFTNKFIKPESFYIKLNDSEKWLKKEQNLLP